MIEDLPDSFQRLLDEIASEDEKRVFDAFKALEGMDHARVPKALSESLRSPRVLLRKMACSAIVDRYYYNKVTDQHEAEQYIAPLIECLSDEDPLVRLGAIVASSHIKESPLTETLIERLPVEQDAKNRWGIVWALAEIGDSHAIEPLIDRLLDSHPNVKVEAARALGHLGDARAIQSLVDVLDDDSFLIPYEIESVAAITVSQTAQVSLEKLGKEYLEHLTQELVHPRELVRAKPASILGSIGDDRAISALIQLSYDKSSLVQEAAKNALSTLRN